MIETVLVDDHRLFSDGLERLLNNSNEFKVVKKFNDGLQFLQSARSLNFDLLLIDIEMKGLDGFETVRRLKLDHSVKCKVVLLSMHDELIYRKEALSIGVDGHISKTTGEQTLMDALLNIMNNESFIVTEPPPVEKSRSILSKQELKVLKLIAQGKSSQDVSLELSISALTVKVHRRNILRKLGANNSAECINIAISKGLL